MDLTAANNGVQPYVSPDSHSKLSQHSPTADDDHDNWSGDASSGDDGGRAGSKRKRPLSVSCETCKQRKVKCDRGHPACGWCLKNQSQCTYLPRKKPGLRAGYGRELESRLGEQFFSVARRARGGEQTAITRLRRSVWLGVGRTIDGKSRQTRVFAPLAAEPDQPAVQQPDRAFRGLAPRCPCFPHPARHPDTSHTATGDCPVPTETGRLLVPDACPAQLRDNWRSETDAGAEWVPCDAH